MAMYEPGVYSGEIIGGPDFMEIRSGKFRCRPGLNYYFLPQKWLADPESSLPMPSEREMPRISIVLWSDADADKEKFVNQLGQIGFGGVDIAEICAGHAKRSISLVGNEVLCRRKKETRKFTKESGEVVEYDQWILEVDSSSGSDVEDDQIAIVEKLRASLNHLIKAKSLNVDGAAKPVKTSVGSNSSPF